MKQSTIKKQNANNLEKVLKRMPDTCLNLVTALRQILKLTVILLVFTSCSTTFLINGQEIKSRTKAVDKSHETHILAYLLVSCALVSTFYVPK